MNINLNCLPNKKKTNMTNNETLGVRSKKKTMLPSETITNRIYFIRKLKVMLDRDLAELYGVETGQLKRSVRRNIDRFPKDFMFELANKEYNSLRSQIGILERGLHSKYKPMVFTEQGVAMLSSVLNSKRAIQVNIQIMRAFYKLRQMLANHEDMKRKIEEMEAKYDKQFRIVFEAIKQLLAEDKKPKRKIGFLGDRLKSVPKQKINNRSPA
jgi:phage regulator Rha-like protein